MNDNVPPPMDVPPDNRTSLASRLTNVFVSPGEVFTEVKTAPTAHSNWWVPALLLVVASWCAAALMFSNPSIKQQMLDIQDKAIEQRLQPQVDSGKLTAAQVDQIKAQAARFSGIGQIIGGFVGPVFQAVITPFWGGFILWVGGTWIFRRPYSYLKGVEAVGLTMVILAVGALVKGLLCAATGNMFASPSPVLLLKAYDATNPLHNALITMDVFALWAMLLRAVGLSRLSEISFAKAAAWVIGMWLLLTGGLIALGWGLQKVGSMMTGQH